jgi:hypothetical protein
MPAFFLSFRNLLLSTTAPAVCCLLLSCDMPRNDNPFDLEAENAFPRNGYICIEDFDSYKKGGYQKTSFSAMMQQYTGNYDCGWLYAVVDSNSRMSPNIAYSGGPIIDALITGIHGQGRCFQASFELNNYGWFSFGFILLNTGQGYDLTGLQKITFDARGSGKFMVELRSNVELQFGKNYWGPMLSIPINLTNDWRTIEINKYDFTIFGKEVINSGITPDMFLKQITNINFKNVVPNDDKNSRVELTLDNIRLYGIEYETFFR